MTTPHLKAVLAPITPALIRDDDFLGFILTCSKLVETRESFRFYVYLREISFDDLKAEAESNESLGYLIDRVHVSREAGEDGIKEIDDNLDQFLEKLEDIEDSPRYRGWLLWLLGPIALASFLLTGVAFLCALILLVSVLSADILYVLLVNAGVMSLGIGAFLGNALLSLISNQRTRVLLLSLGIVVPVIWAVYPILDWKWIAVGALLALPMDHFRRTWISVLPISLKFDEETSENREPLNKHISAFLRLFGGELWPRERRVFISYQRGSWAEELTKQLRDQLEVMEIPCVLDEKDIEVGSCYRHILTGSIRRCTLFLYFDHANVNQPPSLWQRAELLTAVQLERRIGLPDILIIVPGREEIEPLQFYKHRLHPIIHRHDFPIVPLSPSQLEQFARNLSRTPIRPYGVTGADNPFLDLLVLYLFQRPLLFLMSVLMLVTNLGSRLLFWAPCILVTLLLGGAELPIFSLGNVLTRLLQ